MPVPVDDVLVPPKVPEPIIEVGDTVTEGTGKIHWVVLRIWHNTMLDRDLVDLRSGMSERLKYQVPLEKLALHTKGDKKRG